MPLLEIEEPLTLCHACNEPLAIGNSNPYYCYRHNPAPEGVLSDRWGDYS